MFVELLGRSCYSLLRGASRPEELVERARALDLQGLALCDRGGLYGAVKAWRRGKELGQRVIVGAELPLALARERTASSSGEAGPRRQPPTPVVALLAHDLRGYANLCRLLTLAHAQQPKGQALLTLEELAAHPEGLSAVIPAARVPGGVRCPPGPLLAQLRDLFGAARCALAVHRHLERWDAERVSLTQARAQRYGLPIVASARPLYHHAERQRLADVLYCLRAGTTLDTAGTALTSNGEAQLLGEAALRRLFPEHPEWIEASAAFAEPLRFELGQLRYEFPCELEEGESADAKLQRLVTAGAAWRYPSGLPEAVALLLRKELALIARLGVAPYFLSAWEIVQLAQARGILCQGRGSAANSAVCYVLGITAVDPARSSLLFERFLSVERQEPPDIDLDFEHERREEIIQELYARHGRERAAMVSEVISYRGKSALRDCAKAFGWSRDQTDRLSACVSHWSEGPPDAARLREAGFDPHDVHLQRLLELAQQLIGLPRHLSIHVGGFVLSARPLHEVAPVEPAAMPGRSVIPWDKDDIDALGFFKIDVLALGMLTCIRKTLALLPGFPRNPLAALALIPAEDRDTYAMLSRADSVGVFQVESRAQQAMLPRLRPARFYDLVIQVAIVRPGPIQGGMVHPYLRRRSGKEPATSPHPTLEPILQRTLGVPLFQEQVMQVAIVGAGYSGGEADQLRRDMAAWRKSGRLLMHRERLLRGFTERGLPRGLGEALFEQIKGFGEYGFPESHAASFALLVYASAWLKCHAPAAFVCGLLNAQPMGFYSPSSLLRDAKAHGVTVLPIDVNQSQWDCQLEQGAVRLGLRLLKDFGERAAARLVAARAAGPYQDLPELRRRARLSPRALSLLAASGALTALEPERRQALWQARAPQLPGLFHGLHPAEAKPTLAPLRAAEQLLLDYEHTGLSLVDHPLAHHRARLHARGVLPAQALARQPSGARVSVAGLVLTRQRPVTAGGIVFMTLEDETGSVQLVVYAKVWEKVRLVAERHALLVARGRLEVHVTPPHPGEPAGASQLPVVPVLHVVVETLQRLGRPRSVWQRQARNFH